MNTAKTSQASASAPVNTPRPRFGKVVSWQVESIAPIAGGGTARDQAEVSVTIQIP